MYAYNCDISDGNNEACQRFVAKDQQIYRSNNSRSFLLFVFVRNRYTVNGCILWVSYCWLKSFALNIEEKKKCKRA